MDAVGLEDPTKTISLHYQRLIESERFTAGFMDAGKIEEFPCKGSFPDT